MSAVISLRFFGARLGTIRRVEEDGIGEVLISENKEIGGEVV